MLLLLGICVLLILTLLSVYCRVLVRRERCEDGVERVVVRSVCTKIHHIRSDMPVLTNDTRRFAHSTESGAMVCGEFVFNHIKNTFLQQVASSV